MSIPIETLEVAVLRLSPTERARLLDRVVASLDADSARDAAWDGVAAQREATLASGTATETPLDEVLARLKAELA
jgi:Putative addiction module component